MLHLEGTPSDQLPDVLRTGTSACAVGLHLDVRA